MSIGHLIIAALISAAPSAPDGIEKLPAPGWIRADGTGAVAELASPEAAEEHARLLSGEGSHEAASRAWENLVRRWPGAPGAETALLAAARSALAAGDFDRASGLIAEMRGRWPEGPTAARQEAVEIEVAEARLASAGARELDRAAARELKLAYREFNAYLKRFQAGTLAERAALGRARAAYRLGKVAKAVKLMENFLDTFPRSRLVPAVLHELADINSQRARGRSPENQELDRAATNLFSAVQYVKSSGAADGQRQVDAIQEAYDDISVRQAELKIEEARLYLRMKRPDSAQWVLRSVLRNYGETPSALTAAEMLEELSRE